jgi:HEAT repeat protein
MPEARKLIDKALDAKDTSTRIAAISSLAQNPDDKSTDSLLRLARDQDPQVRSAALSTLGQVGSERAQQAILEASRSGKPEDRLAAIQGLASIDDPKASAQLAALMRDADPSVAQTAIGSSYNGGPEVDQALSSLVNDPSAQQNMRQMAANQLRSRGAEIDDNTEKRITELVGAAYGGAGYGGYTFRGGGVEME